MDNTKFCHACGMPLDEEHAFAIVSADCDFSVHCMNSDGSVKSCEEIFEGGVQFFMSKIGQNRPLAEKITRKNMGLQPYWEGKDLSILRGDVATDAEFAEVLGKLGA